MATATRGKVERLLTADQQQAAVLAACATDRLTRRARRMFGAIAIVAMIWFLAQVAIALINSLPVDEPAPVPFSMPNAPAE
ncbi:MAG: hypothetical protein AB7K09_19665 [Planctomycetota bacterium]